MSGKSELVESLLNKVGSYGKGLLSDIGNPLNQLSNSSANTLQRVAGGAAAGGLAGMALNATTGLAGMALSPVTGGLFTNSGSGIVNSDSFSMGSILGSGVRGAALGGIIAGGGFRNNAATGLVEMRSGTKALTDMVAGGMYRMGLGPSANSALGKKALAGEMGDSMLDLVAGRMKFTGKDMKNLSGNRLVAANEKVKMNNFIDEQNKIFQNTDWNLRGSDGKFIRNEAFHEAKLVNKTLNANRPIMPSEMSPVGTPSLKDAAKGHFRKAKENKMASLGAASLAGGLGMSLYQTNALGISIPSNKGYR